MTAHEQSESPKLTASMSAQQKNRVLNDHLRNTRKGGIISISLGIYMLGRTEVENILKRLGGPEGERSCETGSDHDSGEFLVNNRTVYWEINYYNKDFDDLSSDSTDPAKTTRFMTLLLDSEL